jgi:hypothetical protein
MSHETLGYNQSDLRVVSCPPEPTRIFPAPWRVDAFSEGYCVRDAQDHVLVYVVAGEQMAGAESNELTPEEASRIASVIASLPDLVPETPPDPARRSWWKWLKPSSNS